MKRRLAQIDTNGSDVHAMILLCKLPKSSHSDDRGGGPSH
jgi:hypothetical protein